MPYQPTLQNGIAFLTYLFNKKGYSYNQIAMARSALSSVIAMQTPCGSTFGQHPIVKRLVKGIFETKPVFPRYNTVWDVNQLFTFFRNLEHQKDLSVGLLGKKLALLLGILAGGQRAQTIHKVNTLDIKVVNDKCIIPIMDKIKQTKSGKHMKPMVFCVYLKEPKLCLIDNLKEYLKKTKPYRTHAQLLLRCQCPYSPVSKDTISRWCKDIMHMAGININDYKSHSSRSAASSFAQQKGASLKDICDSAGWSSSRTFAAFYHKQIGTEAIGSQMLT